jgi:hypothetical protein
MMTPPPQPPKKILTKGLLPTVDYLQYLDELDAIKAERQAEALTTIRDGRKLTYSHGPTTSKWRIRD